MRRNIYGDIIVTTSDYISLIRTELSTSIKHKINVNYDSSYGFSLDDIVLPKTGLYALYKDDNLIYIGCTMNSIHKRLSRFIAAVRGTESKYENHSAAYKYLEHFGNNLDDLYVRFSSLNPSDLYDNIAIEEIEKIIISEMKPFFNDQTYKNYNFDHKIVILDKLTGSINYA